MKKIEIYADGACRGNGTEHAYGGYGVLLKYGENIKELYEGFRGVTNNQMELRAAIAGLKSINNTNIPTIVYTDSAYVCNCINQKWYKKWQNNGWLTSTKTAVENRELWMELICLVEQFPFLSFIKVKGHSGNEGNERADQLANMGADLVKR